MEIDPLKYEENKGASTSLPTDPSIAHTVLESLTTSKPAGESNMFSTANGGKGVGGNFSDDKALILDIEELYAQALDSIGINFSNPLQAYGTHFRKSMDILNLDPARPGNSYVFFTRPDLNLLKDDVTQNGYLTWLLSSEIGQFVGEYLQYPGVSNSAVGSDNFKVKLDEKFKTKSAFDPLMSNACKDLTGAKDIMLDSYEEYSDFSGHTLSYAAGADGYDSAGELTATFYDTTLSPIFLKHLTWVKYIHDVSKGYYWPKYLYLAHRVIDYTISIYSFKLADDNMTIIRWAKWTGCYPVGIPLNTLNHSKEIKLDELDDISISYKFNFYEPMEPRVFIDFNELNLPMALTNNTIDKTVAVDECSPHSIAKLAKELTTISLTPGTTPEKLFKSTTVRNNDGDDSGEVWAKCPIIVGNKLIFV